MRNVDNQLVSIIVPVFNAEPYLAQCLDSILAQTHRELEVICLNDGSTDGSLAIMQAYAARDERIRVIDGELPADEIAGEIRRCVEALFARRGQETEETRKE